MCSEYSTAEINVTISPNPNEKSFSARTASPNVARTAPAQTRPGIRVRTNTAAHIGVSTTYNPVMNADMAAGVVSSPIV